MKPDKIYKSKSGKQFKIGKFAAPFHNDVVTFTQEEFDWLKLQNLKPDEFDFLWLAKKDNFNYKMIPDEHIEKQTNMGVVWAGKILDDLKNIKKN